MRTNRTVYLLLPLFLFLISCLDSPEMTEGIVNGKKQPTVETKKVNASPNDGVLYFEANITSYGKGEKILSKGFYWSEINSNPTENDNVINVDTNSDLFSATMSNISGEKTFYWKAFAENEYGFDFGDIVSFSTPNIWEEKAIFMAPIRGFFSSCILNDEFFLFGGQKSSGSIVLNETWIYNSKNNSWRSNRTDFEGVRRYSASFTIGNSIYMGTGQRTATNLYNDFYRLDGTLFSWTPVKTNDQIIPRYGAAHFSLNEKGYLVAGSSSTYPYLLQDIWKFDPETEEWERLNDFPVPFTSGVSFSDGHRAFVGFGRRASSSDLSPDRLLWEYNDEEDSWTLISQLPEEFTARVSGGTMLGNCLYVINKDMEIWRLNLDSMEWELKTMAPEILAIDLDDANHLILTLNNSIYLGLNFSEFLFEYRPLWDNEIKE